MVMDVPDIRRLPVFTVTRAQPAQQADGVALDALGGTGLHVGRGAHLQRDASISDELGQPAQVSAFAVGADLDVVDDAHAMAEPLGPAPLEGLPDTGQPERLARMDGEVGVLAPQVLEGVQMTVGGKPASAPAMSKPTTPRSRYSTAVASAIRRECVAVRMAVSSTPIRMR